MSYSIKKVNVEKYSNVEWDCIPMASLVANDGETPKYQTDFQICRNADKLMFRFTCEEDTVRATMTEFNAPIYDEETVELFLSSEGDLSNYLEVEVNALGAVFLANVHNDLNGNTKLDYVQENCVNAVIEKDEYSADWTAYGELPSKLFKGSFDGVWSFNAYRIKRTPDGAMVLMAFSPTFEDNFHKPQYFDNLVFED